MGCSGHCPKRRAEAVSADGRGSRPSPCSEGTSEWRGPTGPALASPGQTPELPRDARSWRTFAACPRLEADWREEGAGRAGRALGTECRWHCPPEDESVWGWCSRSAEGLAGSSRSLAEPVGSSRSVAEPVGSSRSVAEPAERVGSSRSVAEPAERAANSRSVAELDERSRSLPGSRFRLAANWACLRARRARLRPACRRVERGSAARSSSGPARFRQGPRTRAAFHWGRSNVVAALLGLATTDEPVVRSLGRAGATRVRRRPGSAVSSERDLHRSALPPTASSSCASRLRRRRARLRSRPAVVSAPSGDRQARDPGARSNRSHSATLVASVLARRSSHDAGRSRCSRPRAIRSSGARQHTSGL